MFGWSSAEAACISLEIAQVLVPLSLQRRVETSVPHSGEGVCLRQPVALGRAIECVENGLMLGPFSDSRYSTIRFSLEDGDRIVLITDGIIEATDSSDNEFGMERLREIVDSTHSLPVNRLA